MATMSSVQAIKTFFEAQPNGREVTRQELLELNKEKAAYQEVAHACAKALGVELQLPAKS